MNDNIRVWDTGGNRDGDRDKIDPEGFMNPLVIRAYCEYMHKNRFLKNGEFRDADNWQKFFGDNHLDVCMKSLWRHVLDLWLFHRGYKGRETIQDALCGIIFNTMAYMLKILDNQQKGVSDGKNIRSDRDDSGAGLDYIPDC